MCVCVYKTFLTLMCYTYSFIVFAIQIPAMIFVFFSMQLVSSRKNSRYWKSNLHTHTHTYECMLRIWIYINMDLHKHTKETCKRKFNCILYCTTILHCARICFRLYVCRYPFFKHNFYKNCKNVLKKNKVIFRINILYIFPK